MLPDGHLAVIAAHPDDETIGCGALLRRRRDVTIIHATDGGAGGDARTRVRELHAALALVGGPRTIALGIPDQQTTVRIEELIGRLAEVFRRIRPDIILTHPYEGGHPDHDSLAFAVAQCAEAPLYEFTSYHSNRGWIATGCFLPHPNRVEVHALTPDERIVKDAMLRCFASQRETLQYFSTAVESFRRAPQYDFTRPPHEGTLFYEKFDWGMTGDRWRRIAVGGAHAAVGA